MLTIEIKGIGFANRGAELMLRAIMERFQNEFNDVRFVVEPPVTKADLQHYGLSLKAHYLRRGMNVLAVLNLLPKALLHSANIVKTSEVDIVIDASGYSYGDPWSPGSMTNRLGIEIKELKARQVPVVVMPQALGPFEKQAQRDAFMPIYQNADLIFPRDGKSLDYVQGLGETTAYVAQAPDFSNLVKPEPFPGFTPSAKSLCLIPNQKMLDKTSAKEGYINFCRGVLDRAKAAGFEPFILVHEQADDAQLANEILAPLDNHEIPVVIPTTATECKWVISQSRLVVASRFHGLVSALCEAVPAFATSWAHKYQSLLADYDVTEQLIDLERADAEIDRVIDLLADDNRLRAMRSHLAEHSAEQKKRTEQMWQRVFATLKN